VEIPIDGNEITSKNFSANPPVPDFVETI